MSHLRKGSIPVLSRNTHEATFMLWKKHISSGCEILNMFLKGVWCPLLIIGGSPWQSDELTELYCTVTCLVDGLYKVHKYYKRNTSFVCIITHPRQSHWWGYNKNNIVTCKNINMENAGRKKHFIYGQEDLISN